MKITHYAVHGVTSQPCHNCNIQAKPPYNYFSGFSVAGEGGLAYPVETLGKTL